MNPEPMTRIHKDAIKAWRINSILYGLLIFIPIGLYILVMAVQNVDSGMRWYEGMDWVLLFVAMIISLIPYLLLVIIFPKLRWERWKYDVSAQQVDMIRGIIIRKRTLIPINRVQHVDTRQGPVYRKFGLSSVTISTAATTHEIPALDDETADELRNTLSTLVRRVKEDV